MATAGDLINGSLRLIGQLAEGEVPSAATSQDALVAFNQMIESWSTERLSVFTTQDQVFTWPATQASRTIGPTGDFVGTRPIMLDAATYFVDPGTGISYTISIVNTMEYNEIALKSSTSTFPQIITVTATYPNTLMQIYPVPTQALEWHFVSVQELAQAAILATDLSFPPGYLRAFRYNLACELAPEFGVEPSTQIQRIAMSSKRDLKRINSPGDKMALPSGLASNRTSFNIYSGGL